MMHISSLKIDLHLRYILTALSRDNKTSFFNRRRERAHKLRWKSSEEVTFLFKLD